MSLVIVQPENSKRSRAIAVKSLVRFLQSENTYLDYVKGCIQHDDSGKCIVSVMNNFGMYLAFNEGRSGKPLD